MITNKDSVIKQPGNDVEGCRSQKLLLQPSMRVFLQYIVNNSVFENRIGFRSLYFYIKIILSAKHVIQLTYPEFEFETETKLTVSRDVMQRYKSGIKATMVWMGIYNTHACIALGIK